MDIYIFQSSFNHIFILYSRIILSVPWNFWSDHFVQSFNSIIDNRKDTYIAFYQNKVFLPGQISGSRVIPPVPERVHSTPRSRSRISWPGQSGQAQGETGPGLSQQKMQCHKYILMVCLSVQHCVLSLIYIERSADKLSRTVWVFLWAMGRCRAGFTDWRIMLGW